MAEQVERKRQSFFRDGEAPDVSELMTQVEARFSSAELVSELRWRLEVLYELSQRPGLEEASELLRDRLTRIFTMNGEEGAVLSEVRELTEVPGAKGKPIDLRYFLKRSGRRLDEATYRQVLGKKIVNTRNHVINLVAFYPEAEEDMRRLSVSLTQLNNQVRDVSVRVQQIKQAEDHLRDTSTFATYEDLKTRFLREWLAKFTPMTDAEINNLSPQDIQRIILEHQRHQLTRLLKGNVKLLDLDMADHLGIHDTLEGEFKAEEFWKGANVAVRNGFTRLILTVVQAFGMPHGNRYALLQSTEQPDTYMLFGVGLANLADIVEEPIHMVPYMKPFARKAGYLLEVRQRDIGDPQAYNHELVHYALPFIYALDAIQELEVSRELVSFFTSRY